MGIASRVRENTAIPNGKRIVIETNGFFFPLGMMYRHAARRYIGRPVPTRIINLERRIRLAIEFNERNIDAGFRSEKRGARLAIA